MSDGRSATYVGAFLFLSAVAVLLALGFRIQDLLLAGLVLVLYGLHLIRINSLEDELDEQTANIREVSSRLEELSDLQSLPAPPEPTGEQPGAAPAEGSAEAGFEGESVALDLRLGTVAIVENVLEPEQVSKVLAAQEREPEKKFGELAVEAGMIDDDQVDRLLEIQQRGVYSRAKVQSAKARLRAHLRG